MAKAQIILCVLGVICCADAYKILVVFPFPIRSLNNLGEGYVRHLLKAGHEVTFITAFPLKNEQNEKLRQIDISSNHQLMVSGDSTFSIKSVMDGQIPMNDVKMMQEFGLYSSIMMFEHENVKKFLEDTSQQFDAVIVDLYETEIYSGLSALYNCPMIWSYSMGAHWLVLRLIDEPTNPAYSADYLSSNVLPFTFKQRLEELWAQILWTWTKWTSTMPKEKEAFTKYFKPLLENRGRTLPDYDQLIYNASLIFGNEHHAFGNIPRTPQNFKFIGGFHIESPAKPLPKDLQTLMDNSKDGVIYFSMGSTWNSKDLPESVVEGLVKMFGELKQTVIWKFEADLPNLPKNLHITKWAPQPSILAHPNCLFFVTHGGHLSSTEAIHFGVPIIGVPIFFDQFININKALSKGYALKVHLNYDLPRNLKAAIQTMLSDSKYRKQAKELSSIYHHRPVPPGQEMVHWVTHVIRTGGAPHLRSPALNMAFYQKMYLDFAALVVAIVVAVVLVVKKLCGGRKAVAKEKRN
uniref:UDP-glycosyltransferase UGT40AK4 n=1 Tax=Ostrinia furnacalis TaxID=93504 RepID=A0A7H1CRH2_OSTFU|nr:UDP-glycosyltransferase UGT40AK4 [Ostrinia furnacalis]